MNPSENLVNFHVLTFQHVAFSAQLTVMQALPGVEHVCPAFFQGRLFYKRWSHKDCLFATLTDKDTGSASFRPKASS